MAVKEILKTLSDTELCALADEVNNPMVRNIDILNQLLSKSNLEDNSEVLEEVVTSFPEKLSYELSLRLLESNLSRCKC